MSAHGDEEKEMELVQQLAKTSLLFAIIIVVVIVITEGKGRGSTRKHFCHQNDIELLSDKAHCSGRTTNTLRSDTTNIPECRITFALS